MKDYSDMFLASLGRNVHNSIPIALDSSDEEEADGHVPGSPAPTKRLADVASWHG